LQLLAFRANWLGAFQGSQNSYSGGASWNPAYFFNPDLGLRLNAGWALMVGSAVSGGSTTFFSAIDYELLVSYRLTENIGIEAGGGAQTWTAPNSASPSTTNGAVR